MNTRTEYINGYTYCAYCGKELMSPNFHVLPTPQLVCTCEKAKEELNLYERLKDLYNHPLADDLIDKKVELYRAELKGNPIREVTLSGISTVIPSEMVSSLPLKGSPYQYDCKAVQINCFNGEEHTK